jgi:hypothetical protein
MNNPFAAKTIFDACRRRKMRRTLDDLCGKESMLVLPEKISFTDATVILSGDLRRDFAHALALMSWYQSRAAQFRALNSVNTRFL